MRMRAARAFLFPIAVMLACGALAGEAAPILAQTAAVNPPDWDRQTDQVLAAVKAQYGLTDDQVRQIRPLLRAHLPAMRAVFDSYVGKNIDSAPAILKQYEDLRAGFKASVDPILTEPQRKDFMAIRAEFDAEMKKQFIDARMQWFERVIGVDAAQADKLRPIVVESFEKRLQVLSTGSDAKDAAAAQKDIRIQLQALGGQIDARLKTVLTPDQMGKYQDSAGTGAPAAAKKPQSR
jgi:hypothetical protein